jgi:hypothetical protein
MDSCMRRITNWKNEPRVGFSLKNGQRVFFRRAIQPDKVICKTTEAQKYDK